MFTGIIEETGTIESIVHETGRARIVVRAAKVLEGTKKGDSINVEGVCQTVSDIGKISADGSGIFTVFTLAESLKKTTLGTLKTGSIVNLERAVRADTRMGGHIVQGHISATVPIIELKTGSGNVYLSVEVPDELCCLCVPEGSITLDGISLTVANIKDNIITVNIIPVTFEGTSLKYKKNGDKLNLETDIIGRYVERFVVPFVKSLSGNSSTGLTEEKLKEFGF